MKRSILASALLAAGLGTGAAGAEPAAPAAPQPLAAAAATDAVSAAQPATPAELFATECGACHMPYPPALLPVRSWSAIMSGLADHFGEDASLDLETTALLADYLAANAADADGRRSRVLRGLKAGDVPLRITDTLWWKNAHNEVSARAFQRVNVTSKSNCVACHGPGAVRGIFGDD